MMGSLIDIGLKKQKSDWISTLLESKNRSLAGATMPSKGLILKEIEY
jgi:tRNA pseudouridine38-40 synthase